MPVPSSSPPFKRRSLFKIAGLGSAGAAGLPVIAACGNIQSGSGSTQATEGFDFLPTHEDWPLPVEPDLVGEPPNTRPRSRPIRLRPRPSPTCRRAAVRTS
ncbi:hypothetical protein [Glycomyces buryatensis]|uniref:Uncharacterized protein n=1 Tax=Glycomyces buryatensis TaxID=2570927 RepID=A0A4S8PUY4_9ACTN|nr:hypothetical protein [Glycomyces buryatensis]THV35258.1 hypothetical protein FAB82_23680 [Glycomyces buryatensis]